MSQGISPVQCHAYCPKCGKALAGAHSEKSIHCSACGFLLFFNVASAVGAIIADPAGRVLMLRRAKDPRKGKLGAPGGFIDPGESMEEALAREVREEVNLEIATMRYLFSYPNQYHYAGITYPTMDLFFVCTVRTFDTLQALDEVDSIEFLQPAKIDPEEVAFPSLREALRVYVQQAG